MTAAIPARGDEPLVASGVGRALLWVVAVGVALLCASISAGGTARRLAPEAVLGLKPANGFAFANAATALLHVDRPGGPLPPPAVTARARDLAQRSLATEPLATRAWSVLAMTDDAAGRRDIARGRMQAALRLSRRDTLVNMWMVTDASRRGDLRGAMRAIDRTIVTAPATGTVYMPILATALRDDRALPEMVAIMRGRPPWSVEFWREATVSQPALRNAGELRAALALSAPEEHETTATLLRALASAGHYETAERLYRSAQPRGAGGTIVTNGDFRRAPAFPVFDWDLPASGEFSAAIDPGRGVMEVNALPGNGGTVARQLVPLGRGAYRLAVTLASPFAQADTAATIRLKCAREGYEPATLEVRGNRTAIDFDQVQDCPFAWLTIDAVAREGGGDHDLAIGRVALTRR